MDGTLQPSSAVMFATDGKTFRLLCILLTFMNQNIVEIKWFAKGQDLHKYRVSGGGDLGEAVKLWNNS